MSTHGAIGRREFLRRVAGATAAFAVAPNPGGEALREDAAHPPVEPFRARVRHVVRPLASDWGKRHDVEVSVDHIALADLSARANAEVAAQSGARPVPVPVARPRRSSSRCWT